MDFIESGKLATDAVKFFVLDEADRLLDSGSQDLVMKLFSKLPKAATGTQRLQVNLQHLPTTCLCHTLPTGRIGMQLKHCLMLEEGFKHERLVHVKACLLASNEQF